MKSGEYHASPTLKGLVLAPNLPIQVEEQLTGHAEALIIRHPIESETVYAVSESAAEAGIQVGQSVYQAKQMLPTARVVEPDEMAYHARHSNIEVALRTFSPVIETVGLGEFLMDARGLERSFGSEEAIAEAISAAARDVGGLALTVGLATNKFTAQQAARHTVANGLCIVPAGRESAFLAPLPITILPNLTGEIQRRLQLFDLQTLGDLTAIKKAAVLRQFGAEMSGIYELARGNDTRPLNPDVPPLRLVHSLQLTHPIADRQVLLKATARLCWQLSKGLNRKGYHVEALKLSLVDETGQWVEAGRAVKPPTADESRLRRLAAQLLGRVALQSAVGHVILSAYPLRPWHLSLHQIALTEVGVSEKQSRLEEALQILYHRFGQLIVRVAALLHPPQPLKIQVTLGASGLPACLEFGGQTRTVLSIDEAWREEKAWWDRPIKRDYFRVALADESLRNIFQDLINGEWYLDRAWPLL